MYKNVRLSPYVTVTVYVAKPVYKDFRANLLTSENYF